MSKFDIFVATDNHGYKRIIIEKQDRGNTSAKMRFDNYQSLRWYISKYLIRRTNDLPGENLHYKKRGFRSARYTKYYGRSDESLVLRHPYYDDDVPLGKYQFLYFSLENQHAKSQFSEIFSGEANDSKDKFDVLGIHNAEWTDIFIHSPYNPLQSVSNHITGLVKIGSFSLSDGKEVRGTKSKSLAENFISMLGAAQGDQMKAALGKINSNRKRVIENTIIGALHTSRAKHIFMEKNYPLDLYKHLFESFSYKFDASKHHNLDTGMHLIQYIGSADDVVRAPEYYIRAYERLKTDRFFPPQRNRYLDDLFGRTFTRLHSRILQYIYTNISVIQDVVWENVSRSDFIETDLYKDLAKLFDEESHYAAKRSLADIVSWTQKNPSPQSNVMQGGAGTGVGTGAGAVAGVTSAAAPIKTPPPSAPPMPQDGDQQDVAAAGGDARDRASSSAAQFFPKKSTVSQREGASRPDEKKGTQGAESTFGQRRGASGADENEYTPQCGSDHTSCCVS